MLEISAYGWQTPAPCFPWHTSQALSRHRVQLFVKTPGVQGAGLQTLLQKGKGFIVGQTKHWELCKVTEYVTYFILAILTYNNKILLSLNNKSFLPLFHNRNRRKNPETSGKQKKTGSQDWATEGLKGSHPSYSRERGQYIQYGIWITHICDGAIVRIL